MAELSAQGGDVEAFEFNQSNWPSLFAQLPGPVDVLVNNAAVGSKTIERYVPGPARVQEAGFLRINSAGPLWLTQQVLPDMINRRYGKIINISSVGGGVAAFPGFHIADGMSKAAIAYLTRHLAAELLHQPVNVFAICPGAVDTTMLAESALAGLPEGQRCEWEARLPQHRLIQSAEIAEVVWWLAGEAAHVLHGAVLDASMGLGSMWRARHALTVERQIGAKIGTNGSAGASHLRARFGLRFYPETLGHAQPVVMDQRVMSCDDGLPGSYQVLGLDTGGEGP
ncbi:MAG: SDR family oxidoreductase [Pseudonocardiaceae bacterium]